MKDVVLGCDDPMQVFRHKEWCAFINTTQDDYDSVRFFAPGFPAGKTAVLSADGEWKETVLTVSGDGSLVCDMPLPSLKCLLLKSL
jgi:hypothetical protein